MSSLPSPSIVDVTIRDGSNLIYHQFSPQSVAEIASALSESGIQYAEICHGYGIGGKIMGHSALADDEELMEAAKKAVPNLKISAFIIPSTIAQALIVSLADYFELGRIGVNVDNVPSAEKIIKKLKKLNKTVSVQLVRSHRLPPEKVAAAAKLATNIGADIIYLVDTFGSMLPEDVRQYISAIKSTTKTQIGFHGHNHIHMAVSNTLAAWKEGATWLDASLMGVGRDAGNARLESLIEIIQTEGFLSEINLHKLCLTTESIILNIFKKPPYSSHIDLISSDKIIDFIPLEFLQTLSQTLHMPLEVFFEEIKNKMGDSVQVTEDHIKAILKEHGEDYSKLITHISEAIQKR